MKTLTAVAVLPAVMAGTILTAAGSAAAAPLSGTSPTSSTVAHASTSAARAAAVKTYRIETAVRGRRGAGALVAGPSAASMASDGARATKAAATVQAVAVSCSGHGCDGKDPSKTRCDVGSTTVRSGFINNSKGQHMAKVELRWSSKCKTNWGRVTSIGATHGRTLRAAVGRIMPDGSRQWQVSSIRHGAFKVFSPMWYAPDCGHLAWGMVQYTDGKISTLYGARDC